jgi:ElaA protein
LSITYELKHFDNLSVIELYKLLQLRQEVFVVEQDCPYVDADDKDQVSYHLMGRDELGRLVAYTRILEKGISYTDYCSIGRVITSMACRSTGEGYRLMEMSIQKCNELWLNIPIKISAQAHLQKFYGRLGFDPVGETYLEDNIIHIGMVRVVK